MTNLIPQRFHVLFLIGVCLILFLPGFFSLPPTDRDESRFAQASKQMVEIGDYVNIHFQDQTRYKKPIGIYWLQSAAVHVFGQDHDNPIWPYRVPSLIASILAVVFTYLLGRKLFDNPNAGLIAALLLAFSILLNTEARLAKTDAALLACVTIAEWAYFTIIQSTTKQHKEFLVFWLAIAAGVLIKGPLILLVVGLTILTLCLVNRDASYFIKTKPLFGFLILLVCVSPWLIAINQASGGAFFKESMGHDLLGKVAGAQESHGAPPGYYLLSFFITFWPGCLLMPLANPFVWKARHDPKIMFLLAWLIPSWIVFEVMPTKLPHYILPLFPAVALLIAAWAMQNNSSQKPYRWLAFLPFIAVALALGFLPFAVKHFLPQAFDLYSTLLIMLAVVIFILLTIILFAQQDWQRWCIASVIPLFFIYFGVFQNLLPGTSDLWIARSLKTTLQEKHLSDRPVALLGYSEPSAVFLLGTKTQLLKDQNAAEQFLSDNPQGVLIAARKRKEAPYGTEDFSVPVAANLSGFNISKGGWLNITIFAKE